MGARTVPKEVRSRVRRSVPGYASQAAGPLHSQSSPPGPSLLVLRAGARELSERDLELRERLERHAGTFWQYLADASHELRAPIARIKILLERARRRPQGISDHLSQIEGNVLRMEALTQRLLDFTRLELIEEPLVKKACDLAELVLRVVEDARIEAEARGCVLKHALIPSCPVYANYDLLHSAVENVVRNSVQYTKENSSVSVILSSLSNGMVQILVEDEGPGISKEELDEVFQPFYRAAGARASGTAGAGLGLAIAKRAANLHGGRMEARNRSDGKGLEVTIEIPLSNPSEAQALGLGLK